MAILRALDDIEIYVEKITELIADLPCEQRETRLMNLIVAFCEDLVQSILRNNPYQSFGSPISRQVKRHGRSCENFSYSLFQPSRV